MNNSIDQQGFGFNPFFPIGNINQTIRNLENRVSNLEREVNRLRNRINRLDNNFPMPRTVEEPYTNTYQPQGYNMM